MVVATSSPVVLAADQVSFSYDSVEVLQSVGISLNQGEIVGIVGPNGSGKSTLMGVLCGLLPVSGGWVEMFGRPMQEYSRMEIAQNLAVVPQGLELCPGFTVIETVLAGRFALMGRRMFENREDIAAAERALEQTDLAGLRRRVAGGLSGGERQRLALARALASEPKILLLDEPTSALDLKHQLKIKHLLEILCQSTGLAVCLVSHDLNLASIFCRRMLLLHQGRRMAEGEPNEVITQENIKAAFGIDAIIDREPSRNRPRLTLAPLPV